MKKIVLLLAVSLLFGTYANAEEVVADAVAVAVKAADGTVTEAAVVEEAVVKDTANDENWQYHKFQTLNTLKDINEKIEAAKKENKPTAELEAQRDELFKKLDELDAKILAEGNDEEMKEARAKAAEKMAPESVENMLEGEKYKVLADIKAVDDELKAAEEAKKPTGDLTVKKSKLIEQLDEVDRKLAEAKANKK